MTTEQAIYLESELQNLGFEIRRVVMPNDTIMVRASTRFAARAFHEYDSGMAFVDGIRYAFSNSRTALQ